MVSLCVMRWSSAIFFVRCEFCQAHLQKYQITQQPSKASIAWFEGFQGLKAQDKR